MVSTHTNSTGLATHSQHLLREAQQQRIQARPGTQNPYVSIAPSGSDQNLISPHATPQLQAERFDQSCFGTNPLSFPPYGGDLNMMMSRAQTGFGDQMSGGREFDIFNTDSALSTPTFPNFQESPNAQGWTSEGDTTSTRRASRRISNGIMDRVNKFEHLGFEAIQRPITPPNQNATSEYGPPPPKHTHGAILGTTFLNGLQDYFPPTPIETPQGRMVKIEPARSRFTDGYDESMEETIKPSRHRANRRAQNIFQDMRQQRSEQPSIDLLPHSQSFDGLESADYLSMAHFNNELMKLENTFNRQQAAVSNSLDLPQQIYSRNDSYDPEIPDCEPFEGELDPTSFSFPGPAMSCQSSSGSRTPGGRSSAHRRTQSEASIASAASIADINIDEMRTETGITMDQICQYIENPAEPNGKYKCKYPGCTKMFGRRENIKSHIQTHLGDRQYKCPTCEKCFVRQHDLKRHAKIHTGIKPYPCDCGNQFARHDALTRHRQRGMCVGAFDDLPVRKKNKRGRPPKKREGSDERSQTTSVSSSSSPFMESETSQASSPQFDFNNLDHVTGMGSQHQSSSAPMSSSEALDMVAIASASAAMGSQPCVSPEAIMGSNPTSPRSITSQFEPPELTHSSTPPAAGYFDLESVSNADEMPGISVTSGVATDSMTALGMTDRDDDVLLQYDFGMPQIDGDPSMMTMSKFDEEINYLNDGYYSNH